MPEAGRHAPILIAASWQALGRAAKGDADARICNCIVVVLFAGFYVEANLNHIVRVLKLRKRFKQFMGGQRHPGLQDKLAWFYNDFIALVPMADLKHAKGNGVYRKVRRHFPGFAKIYQFRNDISHGVVNNSGRSVAQAGQLREQAKDIVSELFAALERRGRKVRRATSYWTAIQ